MNGVRVNRGGTDELSSRTVLAAMLAFLVIGGAQALYGPALPGLTVRAALSRGTGGLVIGAHWIGALSAVALLLSARVERAVRRRPAIACAVLGASAIVFGDAGGFAVALGAAFGIGFGYGWLTVDLNARFARSPEKRRSAMVNALNAAFGLGAVLAPLSVSWLLADPMTGFTALGGIALLASLAAFGIDDREPDERTWRHDHPTCPDLDALRSHPSSTSMKPRTKRWPLLFAISTAVAFEASLIGWSVTALETSGVSTEAATLALSWFFLVFLCARFAAVAISVVVAPARLVICTLLIACAACFAVEFSSRPTLWFASSGVIGACFPNLLVASLQRLGSVPRAAAVVVMAAFVGGAVGPMVVGMITETAETISLPVLIGGIGLLALGTLSVQECAPTRRPSVIS